MGKFIGTIASYAMEPRGKNGKIDIPKLIELLKQAGITTHCYIMHAKREYTLSQFRELLAAAEKAGIKIWTTLLPPAEDGALVIPHGLDYVKWAEELARLSLQYPNFELWTMDDFSHEMGFFTPSYVSRFTSAARAINPKLAFGVCVYYPALRPFVEKGYGPMVDAVYWGYRSESVAFGGTSSKELTAEIEHYQKLLPGKAVFPIIYVSRHSRWPPDLPTLEYIEDCLTISWHKTGTAFMYCLPLDPDNPKYHLVKRLIATWRKHR